MPAIPWIQVATCHRPGQSDQCQNQYQRKQRHTQPSLLEKQMHPKIFGVPEQMIARFEEPEVAPFGKVSIFQKILASWVQQTHIVHLDHRCPETGCKGRAAPAYSSAQLPAPTSPLLNVCVRVAIPAILFDIHTSTTGISGN